MKTPDVDIKVNPDRLDLVETKFIGGRRCLVIAVEDNVEVNGMPGEDVGGAEGGAVTWHHPPVLLKISHTRSCP